MTLACPDTTSAICKRHDSHLPAMLPLSKQGRQGASQGNTAQARAAIGRNNRTNATATATSTTSSSTSTTTNAKRLTKAF